MLVRMKYVPKPSIGEVKKATKSLKSNKVPGIDNLTADLIKGGGEYLIRLVHQLSARHINNRPIFFIIRQIMEMFFKYNVDVHQVFVDFKQAYDSVESYRLYQILMEMDFPSKLLRLVQITLSTTKFQVKIEGKL